MTNEIEKRIELYNNDCLEVLPSIEDNSIDLVVIDPPYKIVGNGFKSPAGNFKDRDIFKNDIKNIKDGFDFKVFDELERIQKKWNCYIYCNKDLLCDLIVFFKTNYPKLNLDVLVERIKNPTPFCNTYLNNLDYILFIRENGVKINGTYHTKTKYREKNTNKRDKELYKHPTCKYEELISDYVLNSSNEGDVVLDCYMGSGTTGAICKKLNRKFIGVEIEQKYFDIAKERISND